jgi:hypothetical protein
MLAARLREGGRKEMSAEGKRKEEKKKRLWNKLWETFKDEFPCTFFYFSFSLFSPFLRSSSLKPLS